MPETTVIHVRDMRPGDVYIGRANPRYGLPQSDWANPFKIGLHGTREQVIEQFRAYILVRASLLKRLPELRGKRLACWCPPQKCHGDVLKELVDALGDARECGGT